VLDKYYKGRKPNGGFYIPRFRNIDEATKRKDYLRGFGYQGGASRGPNYNVPIGAELKKEGAKPGPWHVRMTCFGELLPYHDNKMYLNFDKRDQHGQPTLVFDATLRENEHYLRKDGVTCAEEMLEAAGAKNITSHNVETAPGAAIHEMGTARMGRDPKTSVLNKWNQVHAAQNVFVTDGSCMTSAGTQNPSITYMALTARAVDHMHELVQRGEL
jgi:choline dehydrogenase-like flavoprotein